MMKARTVADKAREQRTVSHRAGCLLAGRVENVDDASARPPQSTHPVRDGWDLHDSDHDCSVRARIEVFTRARGTNETHLVLSPIEHRQHQLDPLLTQRATELCGFDLVCEQLHHHIVRVVLLSLQLLCVAMGQLMGELSDDAFEMQYTITICGRRRG